MEGQLKVLSFVLLIVVSIVSGCAGSTPLKDVSSVILTEEDVPAHLTAATDSDLAEMGLSSETLVQGVNFEEATAQNSAVFLKTDDPEKFGMVISTMFYPLTSSEALQVDAEFLVNDVSDSSYVNSLVSSLGSDVSNLAGAEAIGEKSLGVTFTPRALASNDGQGDLIIFRRDNALFMIVTLYGPAGEIDTVDLAETLNSRFEAAPEL